MSNEIKWCHALNVLLIGLASGIGRPMQGCEVWEKEHDLWVLYDVIIWWNLV